MDSFDTCTVVRYWITVYRDFYKVPPKVVSRSSGLAKTILQGTVKEKEERAERRRGGKTILKSGQEWTLSAQLGLLKTGQEAKGLLQIYLWCPYDLPRLWDRIK